jgi:hypothetical protein
VGILMDLVAGDAREILLAIGVDDSAGLRDPRRFEAFLSLSGSMDHGWLDLLARAAREVTGGPGPGSFSEACCPLESGNLPRLGRLSERTIERVDPHWIDDVAAIRDGALDRIAARWIDLIECEECDVEPDDKPALRSVVGELVAFCRRATSAEDVLLAWSI